MKKCGTIIVYVIRVRKAIAVPQRKCKEQFKINSASHSFMIQISCPRLSNQKYKNLKLFDRIIKTIHVILNGLARH